MAVTGFTPTAAFPGLLPAGTSLANSNPLLGSSSPHLLGAPAGAQVGAASLGSPSSSLPTRLVSAMKAAIAELRGSGASDEEVRRQILAMHASAGTARGAAAEPSKPRTARKVKSAKTWKTLAAPSAAPAPQRQVTQPTPVQPGLTAPTQLGMAAAQLPGGTVYTMDPQANPALAGLAGLPPQLQQQLGMNPTMGYAGMAGIDGLAAQADQAGPQLNATNQTTLAGSNGIGSAVPVLGAPIVTANAAAAAPAPASGSAGASQTVTNRNANDRDSRQRGFGSPWGSGFGDPTGGLATPATPYGASMNGAYTLGMSPPGQRRGFFSRLFGS